MQPKMEHTNNIEIELVDETPFTSLRASRPVVLVRSLTTTIRATPGIVRIASSTGRVDAKATMNWQSPPRWRDSKDRAKVNQGVVV